MLKVLLVAIVALSACSSAPQAHARNWSVDLSPSVAGESNAIDVHDPDATSTTIDVALRMTDMEMPPLHVRLHRVAEGEYTADHVEFSMSGSWEVTASHHRSSFVVR